MTADEEAVRGMRRAERLAVEHGIQLHQFRTLQIVQRDVQAVPRVKVHAMPVGVGDGGRDGIVLIRIGGVVAFGQHHVEQVVLR